VEAWIVIVVAVLMALGFYLLMQRSISRIVLGLLVLSNAANMVIFTSPGLLRAKAPLIAGESLAGFPHADPLPQALILTAIVIGMGVLAFALGLVFKIKKILDIEDVDEMRQE